MNGKYNAQTNKFVLALYYIKVYATRGNYFVIPRIIGSLINYILAGYYKTNDSIMWAENINVVTTMWIWELENCWSEFVTCFDETFINFLAAENYKFQKFEILIGLLYLSFLSKRKWARSDNVKLSVNMSIIKSRQNNLSK